MSDGKKVLIIRAKRKLPAEKMKEFRDTWLSQLEQDLVVFPQNDFEFAFIDKETGESQEIKWITQERPSTLWERIKRRIKHE